MTQGKAASIKVQCEHCRARYSVPEARIRGRVLRIRCKSCNKVFEARLDESRPSSLLSRGERWFLVVKRERIGPITGQDVRERLQRGDIGPGTYAWRRGFSAWERLKNLPEFSDMAEVVAGRLRRPTEPVGAASLPSPPDPDEWPDESTAVVTYRKTTSDQVKADYVRSGAQAADAVVPREVVVSLTGQGAAGEGLDDPDTDVGDEPPLDEREGDGAPTKVRDVGADGDGVPAPTDILDDDDRTVPDARAVESAVTPIHTIPQEAINTVAQFRPAVDLAVTVPDGRVLPLGARATDPGFQPAAEDTPRPEATEGATDPDRRRLPDRQPGDDRDDDDDEDQDDDQLLKGQRDESSVLFSLPHLMEAARSKKVDVDEVSEPEFPLELDAPEIKAVDAEGAPRVLLPDLDLDDEGAPSGLGRMVAVGSVGLVLGALVLLGVLYLVRPDLARALFSGARPATIAAQGSDKHAAKGTDEHADEDTARHAAKDADVRPADGQMPGASSAVATDASGAERPAIDAGPTPAAAPDAGAAPAERRSPARVAARLRARAVAPLPAGRATRAAPARRAKKPIDKGKVEIVDPDRSGEKVEIIDPDAKDDADGSKGTDEQTKPAAGAPANAPDDDGATDSPAADAPPRTLTRAQLSAGMRAAGDVVAACKVKYKEIGIVTLSVTVDGNSGRLSGGEVLGGFADTKMGGCVLDAARAAARFPRFSGPPISFRHPYILR